MGQCCGGPDEPSYTTSLYRKNEGVRTIREKPIKRASEVIQQRKNNFDLQNSSALKIKKFLKRHDISQLIFNGNGGVYESYLCIPKNQMTPPQLREGGPRENTRKLLSCVKVREDCLRKVEAKVEQLQKLDPEIVQSMLDVFYSRETVYVLRTYQEYDNNNLYRLAHYR